MKATAFVICLAGTLYCFFVTGDSAAGYIFLAGGFVVYLYIMFRAALGKTSYHR